MGPAVGGGVNRGCAAVHVGSDARVVNGVERVYDRGEVVESRGKQTVAE